MDSWKNRYFVKLILIVILFLIVSTFVIAKVATYQVGDYPPKDSPCQKETTCQLGATGSTHYVIDTDKTGRITSVYQGDSQGNYVSVGSVKESRMTMGSNTVKVDYWIDKSLEPKAELKAEKNVNPTQWYKVQTPEGEVTVQGKLIGGLKQEEIAFVQSCDSSYPNPACSTAGGRKQYQETKDKINSVVLPVLEKKLPEALEAAKLEAEVEVGAGVYKAMQVMENSETSVSEDVSSFFTGVFADMNQLAAAGNIAAERAQPKVTKTVNGVLEESGIQVSDAFTEDLIDEQRDNYVPNVAERGSAFLLQGVAWGVAAAAVLGPGVAALTGTTATASAGTTVGVTTGATAGTGVVTVVSSEVAQNMDALVNVEINLATGNYLGAGVEAVSIPFGYFGGKFVRWVAAKAVSKGFGKVTNVASEELAVGATAKTAVVVSPLTGKLEEQVVSPTGEIFYDYFSTVLSNPQASPILERVIRTGGKDAVKVAVGSGKKTINKVTGMEFVEAEEVLFAEIEEPELQNCPPDQSCDFETSVPVGEGNKPLAPVALSNCDPSKQHCLGSSYEKDPTTGTETYTYDYLEGDCDSNVQTCGSVEMAYASDGTVNVQAKTEKKKPATKEDKEKLTPEKEAEKTSSSEKVPSEEDFLTLIESGYCDPNDPNSPPECFEEATLDQPTPICAES